jgi:hypothetical protein
MRKVVNMTQHAATAEQRADGVVDLPDSMRQALSSYLTFETLPSAGDLHLAAGAIADLFDLFVASELEEDFSGDISGWPVPLIGGAPYLMPFLERVFLDRHSPVLYSFSQRESVDTASPAGTKKVSLFRHAGFIEITA